MLNRGIHNLYTLDSQVSLQLQTDCSALLGTLLVHELKDVEHGCGMFRVSIWAWFRIRRMASESVPNRFLRGSYARMELSHDSGKLLL